MNKKIGLIMCLDDGVLLTMFTWVAPQKLLREILFKGERHLKPKFSMFCALSQNYLHCLKNDIIIKYLKPGSESKLSEKLKNGIDILMGQVVLELLIPGYWYKQYFAGLIKDRWAC